MVRFILEQLVDGRVIQIAVPAPDLLGHAGSPLVNAAGDIGIKRRALEGMPVHGIAVGFFLWVNADVLHIGAHTANGRAGRCSGST
jgi:hypothetical protein